MSQKTIQRVFARAQSDQTRTDQSDISPSSIRSKLTENELSESKRKLGFEPPALYVTLMQTVGNGGFGPGYGLMGLVGGATDDMGKTSVELYKDFSQFDSDDPAWKWPYGLLPVCHWGCAIYSCIDSTNDGAPIKTWDPNEWEEGTSPELAIRSTEISLAQWLETWSDGTNIWEKMFPSS
ncbi:SMI1/KNR4 family protein [uncultured Tateyamaria sp.]|uniref:SMI1/KNR4 family protein n=1 Tax=uncultured Tateyamaria sp. TaxID=455651 RepID=UPI002636F676|nr:SMI1/KNR4 family protein [uncultured Tateyamaria sp.]